MKGLMFAADEVKRQFGELEERYQGLEVEYTEKAEQEIVMRRGKERAENALVIAEGNLKTANSENEEYAKKLRDSDGRASNLRTDLNSLQEMYDDMVSREQERLETNVDVGCQFAPVMASSDSQTEFKTPEMTLRQINCFTKVPHHRWGAPVITPMLADDRTVAMLQLPISYSRPVTTSTGLFRQSASTATPATLGYGDDASRPETAASTVPLKKSSLHKHGALSPIHHRGASPGPLHYQHPPSSPMS